MSNWMMGKGIDKIGTEETRQSIAFLLYRMFDVMAYFDSIFCPISQW